MDKNQKALSYYVGVLASFIVAALFHYVIGWGASFVIAICALTNLYCLAAPQSVTTYLGGPFRTALFVVALILGGLFALMFMSGTLAAIYMVAIVAATLFAIARA